MATQDDKTSHPLAHALAPAVEDVTLKDPDQSGYGTSSKYGPDSRTFLSSAEQYIPVDTHENKHRWDPSFQWTEEEEKKLVRTVCTKDAVENACLMFLGRSQNLRLGLSCILCPSA